VAWFDLYGDRWLFWPAMPFSYPAMSTASEVVAELQTVFVSTGTSAMRQDELDIDAKSSAPSLNRLPQEHPVFVVGGPLRTNGID